MTLKAETKVTRFTAYCSWAAGSPAPKALSRAAQETCRKLFAAGARVVHVCRREHSSNTSRYVAAPGEAIYVQATPGSWGKRRVIRRGEGVRP